MFEYYNGAESFTDFVNYFLNKLDNCGNTYSSATIIVANKGFLTPVDSHVFTNNLTIGFINRMERILIILVESLEELYTLLRGFFKIPRESSLESMSNFNYDSKLIGLFGILDHFITTGNSLINFRLQKSHSSNINSGERGPLDYMLLQDFTGQTVNRLCNLLESLHFYRKIEVVVCEQNHSIIDSVPTIWKEFLPNTEIEFKYSDSIEHKHIKENYVQLGLILSKWMQIKY